MDAGEISTFLESMQDGASAPFDLEQIGDRTARVRMPFSTQHLRPGGIVSGPSLMTLADFAVWVAVLSVVGPVAMAVTVNLNIHFFRQVPPGDVIAETRLHKVGRRLATGDVLMYADGDDQPVAHATVTYAIPSDAPRID